jgi:hypothetical protein
MNRQLYLRAILDLYLAQPDTPAKAQRADWAIAASFYQRGLPLEIVAHAIRLATLRRLERDGDPLEPIHSLAYYRRVLDSLTPEALDPGYIAYVALRQARSLAELKR